MCADDDLDLYVSTPVGGILYYGSTFDPESRGNFEGDALEGQLGFHAESVFFPRDGSAPDGEYEYWVEVYEQNGVALDQWTLTLSGAGTGEDRTIVGTGDSETYIYAREQSGSSSGGGDGPEDGEVLLDTCSVQQAGVDCCLDSECSSSYACIGRTCREDGSFVVVLSWIGGRYLTTRILQRLWYLTPGQMMIWICFSLLRGVTE